MRPRLFASRTATAETHVERLRAMLDASRAVMCLIDVGGIVRSITPNAGHVLGEACDRAAELELHITELLQTENTYEVQRAIEDLLVLPVGEVRSWVFKTRAPNGAPRWLDITGANYLFDTTLAGLVLEIHDVSSTYPSLHQQFLAGYAFEHSLDSVIITNAQGFIEYVNPAFEKISGYRMTELRGRTPATLKSDKQGPEFFERMWVTLREGSVFRGEIANRKKTGEIYFEDISIQPVLDGAGEATHFISTGRDITERKRHESATETAAFYDPVSGISTFNLLRERSKQMLALARRHGHTAALLHIDLNGLQSVNTALGRDVGDELLRKFADRLKQGLRESDTIARLRSDEFLILLSDVAEEDATARVVRRLKDSVSRPFQIRDHSINLGASFGVALYPQDATTFDEMLDYADLAMKRAQTTGTGYEFYRKELTELTQERMSMEDDLRWAWERKQFVLHYQPVVQVSSGQMIGAEALTRGHIIGVEALARWPHMERGEISPAQFIPVAERTGRIVALDRWAIATATRQAAAWSAEGWKGWVSVNLSARSLHDADLPAYIQRCIEEYGLEEGRLVLEVTESAAMRDTEITARILSQLKNTGALIALDDFGVGHSSLAYLKHFPVDLLKLDHNFIQGIGYEKKHEHLMETMITLAHRIGALVVAEGVEEEEQLSWLKNAECDFVQGYLTGRPCPPDHVFKS
ncbi:MAG TPA: EAL domain-containing protein [Longimicrobiales bacterium]|nr:EAL domain-containing protein [Longimicrobiales bacterium]